MPASKGAELLRFGLKQQSLNPKPLAFVLLSATGLEMYCETNSKKVMDPE
jgi:hypothetical protein